MRKQDKLRAGDTSPLPCNPIFLKESCGTSVSLHETTAPWGQRSEAFPLWSLQKLTELLTSGSGIRLGLRRCKMLSEALRRLWRPSPLKPQKSLLDPKPCSVPPSPLSSIGSSEKASPLSLPAPGLPKGAVWKACFSRPSITVPSTGSL